MKASWLMLAAYAGVMAAALGSPVGAGTAQTGTAASSTANIIVTVEARRGGAPPALHADDVIVYEGRDRVPVTGVTPLQPERSAMELYLVIDEAIGPEFGTQLNDVRKFVTSLPAGVAVGVAYLRNGATDIAQKPTPDHAAAAKAVRLPVANTGSSPFESISALLKQWPERGKVGEIAVISSGIEPFGPLESTNPYVEDAIAAAQRAHVPVFAIYAPPLGHLAHTYWRATWGQMYLSRLADETGGEGYGLSGIRVVTYAPFLNAIAQRIQHQYQVAFTPKPQPKAGLAAVRVTTELSNIDLVAPDRVWVGATE